MLRLDVNGYTREQVIDKLHGRTGSRGIVKFRFELLNKNDIKLGNLTVQDGSITMNSLAQIKRTATFFGVKERNDIDWLNDRIRPIFCLQLDDNGWAEWPLGVFLLSSPTRKDINNTIQRDIEAYDLSLILKEDKFTDRYLIPDGKKYIDAVIDILSTAGIRKVNIIDHPGTLSADKEFEIGTEKITAINDLLAAINYTSIWTNENGFFISRPYLLPSEREVEYEYRTNDLSVIHSGSTEELDLFDVPNKWVRYVSNPDISVVLRSEHINDLSVSPTSTINRGRTIVDIEPVDDVYDQDTLDGFVKRVAYQSSQVYGHFDFATAVMPHHSFYNCLYIEHTGLGINGKYMESSWTLPLRADGAMLHRCRKVIRI